MARMTRAFLFLLLLAALAGAQVGQSQRDQTQAHSDSSEAQQQYESAAALFKQEKYDEAQTAAKRAVEMSEKNDGRESLVIAQALSLLASIDRVLGHNDQAEPLYRRAVSIWEKKADVGQSDYVVALEGYTCLLQKEKRKEDAEKYGRRARDLIARLEGNSATHTNSSALNVASGVVNQSDVNKPQQQVAGVEKTGVGDGEKVLVDVTVDETGRVIVACAQSGPVRLREVSEHTAYRWRFKPTLLSGEPVKVRGTITFNFKLNEAGKQ